MPSAPVGVVAAPVAAPKRKPLWQVKAEAFVEAWLPRHVRFAGGAAAMFGAIVGVGIAIAAFGAGAREPRDLRTILIRSTPAGATVTLDDVRLEGATPVFVDARLDDGQHTAKIALAAGTPAQRKFTLARDDRGLMLAENLQSSGTVIVESRPPKARVLLDGVDKGATPLSIASVSTDKAHVVEVRKDGYKIATSPIPVDRPAELKAQLALEPLKPHAKVTIVTSIPAIVDMDGQGWGKSGEERDCPPGRHNVVVRIPELALERGAIIDVPERGVARFFVPLD